MFFGDSLPAQLGIFEGGKLCFSSTILKFFPPQRGENKGQAICVLFFGGPVCNFLSKLARCVTSEKKFCPPYASKLSCLAKNSARQEFLVKKFHKPSLFRAFQSWSSTRVKLLIGAIICIVECQLSLKGFHNGQLDRQTGELLKLKHV